MELKSGLYSVKIRKVGEVFRFIVLNNCVAIDRGEGDFDRKGVHDHLIYVLIPPVLLPVGDKEERYYSVTLENNNYKTVIEILMLDHIAVAPEDGGVISWCGNRNGPEDGDRWFVDVLPLFYSSRRREPIYLALTVDKEVNREGIKIKITHWKEISGLLHTKLSGEEDDG